MGSECSRPEKHVKAIAPVTLNVYNLVDNEKLSKFGFGLYHSGIEVYGKEYSFGGGCNADTVTGVFAIPPKTAPAQFRESIMLGMTQCTPAQVQWFVNNLEQEWTSSSYSLLARNCNHFSEAFASMLGSFKIPAWVNRAARVGDAFLPQFLLHQLLRQMPSAPRQGHPPCKDQASQHQFHDFSKDPHGDERNVPLPEIPDNLKDLTVRQLKTLMHLYSINWDECVEKSELIDLIEKHKEKEINANKSTQPK
jgi:hypothetical protein